MKLLYAFNQRRNRWYVVDDNTKEEISLRKKELIELYKNEGVHNIKIYGDEIKGLGYSLSRFTDSVPNGRAYVFRQMLKDGVTKYYVVTTAKGEIMSLTEPELYKMARETGLVNIDIDKFREGHIKLLDNTYEINNISTKSLKYTYDIEDYMRLYKRYKKYGFSMDKPKVGEYSAVFDVAVNLDCMKVESDYESFTKNHKLVVSIFNSAKVIGAVPLYEHIKIEYAENKYKYTIKGLVGYIVSIEVLHKGQVYRRQIIIDKADKKLLAVVSKASKFSGASIKDLVTYENHRESNIDGFMTKDEIENNSEFVADYTNMLNIAKSGQAVSLNLKNGKYVSEGTSIQLKIRNNLKINAMENRHLLNILLN